MKELLIEGKTFLLDDDDYDKFKDKKWTLYKRGIRGNCFYPYYKWRGFYYYLHREIVKCPDGLVVDHKDGNTFNDQKYNLRIGTAAQNSHHRAKSLNSKQKGLIITNETVTGVCIIYKKVRYIIKPCSTFDATRLLYDLMALYCYEEFANTNFTDSKNKYLLFILTVKKTAKIKKWSTQEVFNYFKLQVERKLWSDAVAYLKSRK